MDRAIALSLHMFTLLSYNINFGKKLTTILDWLVKIERKNNPFDIICFQEFPYEKIDVLMFSRRIKTDFRFAPSMYFKKKIYGQLTLFNKNTLKLINSAELSLSTGRIEKKIGQLFRRSTKRKSLLTLFGTDTGKHCMLANTHLTCFAMNNHRINQLKKVCKEIQYYIKVLIVGDFNYTSVLPRFSLKRLMKKYQFEDATVKLKTHRIFLIKHQLDYIFTKGIRIKQVTTERLHFSDHYPLMAEFEI